MTTVKMETGDIIFRLNITIKQEQKTIIDYIFNKNDVFAVLTTGFGKSLIYTLIPKIQDKDFPLDDITNESPRKDSAVNEGQCRSKNINPSKLDSAKKRNVSSDSENITECNSKRSRILSPQNSDQNVCGTQPFTDTANKGTPPRQTYMYQNHHDSVNVRTPHVIDTAITQCRSGPSNTEKGREAHSSHRAPTEAQPSNTPTLPHRSATRQSKRKFPGPAGLLPKLPPGRSPDVLDVTSVSRKSKSPEQINVQKDDIVMSSQSSEEVFTEAPWQTLLNDLGENGQRLQRRWTLVSSLHKARKKQLLRGKVAIAMCVIDTIDWQGGDASVMLRDTSGRMPGTIHIDVMREHDSDVQQGTVLVLRQVSVISPTARNHYLNITPSNLVTFYTKRDGKVFTKCFIHKDHSLCEVLTKTEAECNREEAAMRSPATNATNATPRLQPSATRGPSSTPYRFQPRTPGATVPRTPNAQNWQGHTPRIPISGGVPRSGETPTPGGFQRLPSGMANTPRLRGAYTPVSRASTPCNRAVGTNQQSSVGGTSRLQTPRMSTSSNNGPRYTSLQFTPNALSRPLANEPNKCTSNTASSLNQSSSAYSSGAGLRTPNTSVLEKSSHFGSKSFHSNSDSVLCSSNSASSNSIKDTRDTIQTNHGNMSANSLANPSVETTPSRKGFKFKSVNKGPNEKISAENINNRSNTQQSSHHSFTTSNKNNNANNFSANSNSVSTSFIKDSSVKPGPSVGCKETVPSGPAVSSAKSVSKPLPRPCFQVDSEWNDDLSDDLLSQLSDEMM